MSRGDKNKSKFLSLVLRHKPQTIGLTLDQNGWAFVEELLSRMNAAGHPLTIEELKNIVDNNDKKRFAFSEDGKRLRASQGHSIDVELNLQALTPPPVLYHGTATRNIESIKQQGLIKGSRHHVHLSADIETARKVGMRYGAPVVLTINAKKMYEEGITFFQSENGVWLTDGVPPQYIVFTVG
jgi:putative RNA 2'-phosphotransferase